MNALEKFEDIIKDGVAPFVGREGEWVDPLSQLSSLTFSPTLNTNAVEPKDAVMKSDTEDEEKTRTLPQRTRTMTNLRLNRAHL